MADPLSISASIVAVGGLALKSSLALYTTIRGLQSQNKDARALKAEVGDLNGVLQALLETVADHPNLDFAGLQLPLERCGKACEEYGKIIARCTKHTKDNTTRSSVRDWITQKYLQGDINDFKAMLAAYKSTINIALANANLRIAAISPEVLEDYKDLIADTKCDLGSHLEAIQEKIDRLQRGDSTAATDIAAEWQAIQEEKQSTRQGLEMCAQLSAQIVKVESSFVESTKFSNRPSARKHAKSSLGDARGSVHSLIDRLRTHQDDINKQLEVMSTEGAFSEPVAAQLERLRQTKESVSQCIQIVSEAGNVADERSNVFEDINLADNSYAFSVSTVSDLVIARRLDLSGRSRHFGGQVNDDTVQKSIAALAQLDALYLQSQGQSAQERSRVPTEPGSGNPGSTKGFYDRHGPGVQLSLSKTG